MHSQICDFSAISLSEDDFCKAASSEDIVHKFNNNKPGSLSLQFNLYTEDWLRLHYLVSTIKSLISLTVSSYQRSI